MPDAFTAIWAASAASVAVPVNPLLRPDHMVEIMRAARVTVVVSVGPQIDADLAARSPCRFVASKALT